MALRQRKSSMVDMLSNNVTIMVIVVYTMPRDSMYAYICEMPHTYKAAFYKWTSIIMNLSLTNRLVP